jgi:hypothetical protein
VASSANDFSKELIIVVIVSWSRVMCTCASVLFAILLQNLFVASSSTAVSINHNDKSLSDKNQVLLQFGTSYVSCNDILSLLQQKKELNNLISKRINESQIKKFDKYNNKELYIRLKALQLYEAELNASENSFYNAMRGFNQTVVINYDSLEVLKLNCKQRLSDIRASFVLAEQIYNNVVKLIEDAKMLNFSHSHHKMVSDLMSEISLAADKLEEKLKQESFDDIVNKKNIGQSTDDAEIETVVKLRDGHETEFNHLYGEVVLVDTLSNRYTLSRSNDITVLIDDPHLSNDIILLLILCTLLGAMCCLMSIPPLFGFGVAGMLLGPTGYNIIKCVVQVETIGEFGPVFIIFMAGLKFSLENLRKVCWLACQVI